MRRTAFPQLFVLVFALCGAPLVSADEEQDAIAAAEAGDMIDQADLGTAYFFGNGVPQDYSKAYVWSAVAAEAGLEDAIDRRDKAAEKLTPEELEKAKADTAALLQKLSGK